MRCPRISMLYIIATFLFCFCLNAQTKTLSTLPSSVYLKKLENHSRDSLRYKTLNQALKATQLDDLLTGNDDFTIFAPSEFAFSNIPSDKLNQLLYSEDKRRLNYIMSSHIVPGKLTASKILLALCNGGGRAVFTTIQGNKLIATMKGLDIILTDNIGNKTKITTADLNRNNTVVHEIDSVLVASKL